ncbi:Gfo/Idh/MocA family oxidoreductase [Sunxiuqinia sp. A32]|uniref:Gfo/Idh/MocA family oxidoreductase n=1 Tax=Sunxiuqinia sp. A32 TaxID=3461496 RepID=UPI004045C33C
MKAIIQTAITSFGMSGRVFHGPSLAVNPSFHVKYILERSKNLSKQLFPDAKIVRTYQEILNDPDIQLIIINTPDKLHYEMSKLALEKGKHVVIEKPLTQTVEQANELIQLAKKNKLMLSVYQNRRWDGDFLTVQKIVENKMLGKLVEFESHFDRYRNFIKPNTWKEEKGEKHGVLYNLGSHMIDQGLVLFGMPQSVTAHLDTLRDQGQVKDYYDIRMQYKGFAAILKSSYLVREPGPRYSIHGTLGSFHKWGIDPQEEALNAGHLPNESGWGTEAESKWGTINTEIGNLHYKGSIETKAGNYNLYYENIYDVLVNNEELQVKPEESRDGLIILEACLKSDQEKRTIIL